MKTATGTYLSAIFFLLPLIVTNSYYNITETKSVTFHILSYALIFIAVTVFAVNLVKKAKASNDRLQLSNIKSNVCVIDICMILYGIFTVLSAVLSDYTKDAWLGTDARYQGALTIIVYLLIYFIVSRNYYENMTFLFYAAVAFSIVCLVAVCNNFNLDALGFYEGIPVDKKDAYVSTIGNINFYSSYICLLLPLIICGFCQTEQRLSKIVYTSALIIGSCGMMVTSSESFMVGFLFSLAIIPLFFFYNTEMLKKYFTSIIILVVSSQVFNIVCKLVKLKGRTVNFRLSALLEIWLNPIVAIVLVAASILGMILIKKNVNFKPLFCTYVALLVVSVLSMITLFITANFLNKNIGAFDQYFKITSEWGNNRGDIWKTCIELFKDFDLKDKLFGIGPESLQRISETSSLHGGLTLDQAHNEYLQYLLTIGIFGLCSYLTIIVSVCYTVIKILSKNTLAVGIFAGLVSYWIQAFVNIAQPFTTPIMYLYIAIIGGIYLSKKTKKLSL